METFRLSSKLRENEREYLIQTTNDVSKGAIATTVFVDGVRTDTYSCPYPEALSEEDLLTLVKQTHGDRKAEMEGLLTACRKVGEEGDRDAMFRLAAALYYRRLYDEAVGLLEVVTRLDADNHQAHQLLARTSLELGRTADAVRSATNAVRLRPGYADYRNSLAEALLAAGAITEAVAELEAAISINLYYGEAYFNLGLARTLEASQKKDSQQQGGTGPRLVDYFKKAQLIHPEMGDMDDYRRGLQALAERDYTGALNLLRHVRETYREYRRREFVSANRRVLAADDYLSVEALNEQIHTLRRQLADHPNYLDLQTELARCYFELAARLWDQGLDECRRILETHSGMPNVGDAFQQAQNVRPSLSGTVTAILGKG